MAGAFDRIIVKEDADSRGRLRGETAGLLCEAIRGAGRARECLVVFDEREAIERALEEAESGELVVVFYDDLERVRQVLARRGGRPARQPLPAAHGGARRRFGT